MKHFLLSLFFVEFLLRASTASTFSDSDFHQDGDYLIGGLFNLHAVGSSYHHHRPEAINCSQFQLMRFSVEEVNNSSTLLPNVSLGYEIFDHCSQSHNFPDIFQFMSVNGMIRPWAKAGESSVIAVVGPFTSSQTWSVAPLLMMDLIPVVSYASTSSDFSEQSKFPAFLRTIPPNKDTIEAIFNVLQHFDWRWVAFLNGDNDFGIDGLELFRKKIYETDICLAYSKGLGDNPDYKQIFNQIEAQNVHIIIVFAPKIYAEALINSAIQLNVTNKVWIADDGWSLDKKLPKMKGIHNIGTILGVSQPLVTIAGFNDFILTSKGPPVCGVQHRLCNQVCNCRGFSAEQVSTEDPLFSFPVYSAVYAIAHALHNTLQCGTGRCNNNITAYPHKGEKDWRTHSLLSSLFQVPDSYCSPECPVGYAKKQSGIHKCCFTCVICQNGTYINTTEDPYTCKACSDTEWSPEGSTRCNLRLVEYVPFTDPAALGLMVISGLLVVLTLAVCVLFAFHYNTPVVRSAGGSMCFLILGCLSLSSISVFFYFGKPSVAFCIFRFLPFLLFYTVCVSCFVVRSFQIVCIFKIAAKFPKLQSWWMKYHGQWVVISVAFVIQALLLLIGYSSDPPKPHNETFWYLDKIILGCDINLKATSTSVIFLLTLCILCFIFSYMGKDLPKNYNEAKSITFCLMLLILTWVIFATEYMLYHGRHIVTLNALAVLFSLYLFIFWYFLPKCYIIMFQPDKNTQQYFQGLIQSYTKTISQ
uniref:Taste receptor type 1 member 1-like n=1 Tax=Gouania willdenowi TaxID=441366 RepID=A0A8C5GX39_GOUWI